MRYCNATDFDPSEELAAFLVALETVQVLRCHSCRIEIHNPPWRIVTRMLQAGRDLATIGSITGHTDKSLILHYGHASTERKDQAMEVLEKFAGNETL